MKRSPSQSILIAAFVIPFLYWIYLLCTAHTQVVWDSLDYERLGKLLTGQNWTEYFKTGPNREILYPLFISFAMRLGSWLSVNYLKILVVLQFFCLFLTQFFTFKILQNFKVKPSVIALTIFYIGVSPALVNSALSLYSEILILPLVPAIILLLGRAVNDIAKRSVKETALAGLGIGLLLAAATLIKAVFEVISPLLLLSSLFLCKKSKNFRRHLVLVITALLVFEASLLGYKSLNKTYNGTFTLTDRASWALYGFAVRRTQPLTPEHWLTALAWVPGEGACDLFFEKGKCEYWGPRTADDFGMNRLRDMQDNGENLQLIDEALLQGAKEAILSRPVQWSSFFAIETLKIFFWESSRMAFVEYPKWLEKIFYSGIFKNFIRCLMALLSFCGFVYLLLRMFKKPKWTDQEWPYIFLSLILIAAYTALYSLFWINTRYALPMAPLFLINIALFLHSLVSKKLK